MRQMFVNKVKETEAELKEKEREVSLKWSLIRPETISPQAKGQQE